MKVKLEYIWVDGYKPEPNLRSKTKVVDHNQSDDFSLEDCPMWSYDGSSTKQADGKSSDCLLKPVRIVKDVDRTTDTIPAFLVLCEVLNPDGSPHKTNKRRLVNAKYVYHNQSDDFWFGFEQEYTLVTDDGRPLGFPMSGYPAPQGMYYCSVGHGNLTGRDIVEEHLNICLGGDIDITGVNAEVMLGQWEYQVLGKGSKRAADDLWITRYLLHRVCEKYGVTVQFHPKPVLGDWNGSGLHTNFSNKRLREVGGEEYVNDICDAMSKEHSSYMKVYGSSNELRLTGNHETQHIDKFTYGVSDRGASIRIPIALTTNGWKGYLEDRRPASNADPYQIVDKIVDTINRMENVPVTV